MDDWVSRGNGLDYFVTDVANENPLRVKEVKAACTYTEILTCWADRKARQEGFGFRVDYS